MNVYKTYITIADPKQVVLSDLPFQAGQKVEVIILAKDILPKLISGEIDVEHLKITTEDIAA